MKWRPSKWILYAPVAILPLLAAWVLNSKPVQEDIVNRATAALTADGIKWAKLAVSGRDATLSGDAPSAEAIDKAVAAVAGTAGVRRVESAARVVEPPPLVPPTVESIVTNSPTPQIRGTWPEGLAETLTVTAGGTAYVLGTAKELTSKDGAWTLLPPAPLPDGTIEVTVEVKDQYGRTATSAEPGRVTIDTVAPAAPTIAPLSTDRLPLTITGTWPESDAASLSASLAGKIWILGRDAAFTSDGKGAWSLSPDIPLDPGTYDLVIEATDAAGNVAADTSKDEIVVSPPPPPKPVMLAPTVTAATETVDHPAIRGTWSEIAAKSLKVKVAGLTFVLGKDAALTSDGIGNWTLAVPVPLTDGVFDVAVETADEAGLIATDATTNEITIDAEGPVAPTVLAYAGESSPASLSGSFDAAVATTLKVAIPAAGLAATLGSDASLTAAGDTWTLTIASPLAPGAYDVVVETADSRGRVATDGTRDEVQIKAVAAPPPPPPEFHIPTVTAYSGESSPSAIAGTWDEAVATSLKVAIPGAKIAATLGADAALTSDGKGNWSLALASPLAPGIYDVAVETADQQGRVARDASTAEIYVKEPPPPPPPPELHIPTVTTYSGESSPSAIAGTWDEAVATSLKVAIPGAKIAAALGADAALASDGKGNWSLRLSQPIAPGIYDVTVVTADSLGRTVSDATTAEIYIKEPPPPPPPPYDCEGELARITADHAILFGFNEIELKPPYDQAVNEVASLLADPRCTAVKVAVTGHADYLGPRLYNQALSELRAQVVVNMLAAAGVEPSRLMVIGRNSVDPADPGRTKEARHKSRRVVITVVK